MNDKLKKSCRSFRNRLVYWFEGLTDISNRAFSRQSQVLLCQSYRNMAIDKVKPLPKFDEVGFAFTPINSHD